MGSSGSRFGCDVVTIDISLFLAVIQILLPRSPDKKYTMCDISRDNDMITTKDHQNLSCHATVFYYLLPLLLTLAITAFSPNANRMKRLDSQVPLHFVLFLQRLLKTND